MVESGFLVMARITGFDAFMTSTELEHGAEVTADLLQALLDQVARTLQVQGVRSDYVWAAAADRHVGRPALLLDVLERLFIVFKETQRQMVLTNTCACAACRRLPELGLGLVAHHGEYVRQGAGERLHLLGRDAILARQLLLTATAAWPSYLVLTPGALGRLGLAAAELGLRPDSGQLPELGRVDWFAGDLAPVWQREEETRCVRVDAARAVMRVESLVSAPPAVTWDWLSSPDKRMQYESGLTGATESPLRGRRPGVGMSHHCDHGNISIHMAFRDWRPYTYFTWDAVTRPLGFQMRGTIELAPAGPDTRVTMLVSPVPGTAWWHGALLRWLRPRVERKRRADMERLAHLLANAEASYPGRGDA